MCVFLVKKISEDDEKEFKSKESVVFITDVGAWKSRSRNRHYRVDCQFSEWMKSSVESGDHKPCGVTFGIIHISPNERARHNTVESLFFEKEEHSSIFSRFFSSRR
jgi:hypothetical protein